MKVLRDDWGVPHIAATDEIEGFRAVGYAQAEDHLPRILRHYTMVRGQAAAAFGPEWVSSDRSQLRWNHFTAACRQFDLLPARDRVLYDAFLSGIRAYMNDHPEQLPEVVPELHPALPIATYRMFLWHFMVVDALEAATRGNVLDPEITDDLNAIINLNASASNEWVVLPRHVVEGATVVVSDPHGPIGEFPMFEYRLRAGRFDVIGVSTPGALPPILGHTDGVGWGSTTGAPRVSDCYLLETRAEGTEYRHEDRWRPVRRLSVSLDVKGADPATVVLDSVTLNDIDCPVIGRQGDRIAVACTSYAARDMRSMDETLLAWASSHDLADFTAGAALMSMFPSNIMAGDRHGDALYVRLGLVPRRGEGVDPTLPIEGYDQRTRWHGFHNFEELVQIRNPDCGYMHNNNVAPDTMFPGAASALAAENYPGYLFNDIPGRTHDRGLRAQQGLGAGPLTVDALVNLALDDSWPTTPAWRDALATANRTVGQEWTEDEDVIRRELLGFSGDCRPESVGALAYYYWRTSIPLAADPAPEAPDAERRIFHLPDATAEAYPHSRTLWAAVESGSPLSQEQQKVLLEAVRIATRRLLHDWGRTDICFGEAFRIGPAGRDFPARSIAFPAYVPDLVPSPDVVMPLRAMAALPSDAEGRRRVVSGGRSWRLVAFTDPIRSYSVVLYGQSSRPESSHASDQCSLYSEARVRETGFATLLEDAD